MRSRCQNPKHVHFDWYGGRGITVCERWQSFENFFADMGKRPDGTSIDRIDTLGNYEPGNCRWATTVTQNRNRGDFNLLIEFKGERRLLLEWAQITGIKYQTIWRRIYRANWSIERALSTPVPASAMVQIGGPTCV
jgi:hypothetical protein